MRNLSFVFLSLFLRELSWDSSKKNCKLCVLSRSSPSEVFLRKGILKICRKFTGEHPCRSVISIKLQSNFIKIALRHRCSPVNLLQIFRTPFPRNTSGWLLLFTMSRKCLEGICTLQLAKCQGNPCSKQTRYLKIKSI